MHFFWRDTILQQFTRGLNALWLVSDPDHLLQEEGIGNALYQLGFEVMVYADQLAWRYAFELGARSRWDAGEALEIVVCCELSEEDLEGLPFDLLEVGHKLSIGLDSIFPGLSLPVVAALDRSLLDILWTVRDRLQGRRLGEAESIAFILKHVFQIETESLQDETDLLSLLARLHSSRKRLPVLFAERLEAELRDAGRFKDWPLVILLTDEAVFFGFLQERWPLFLKLEAGNRYGAGEPEAVYGLQYAGPPYLSFDAPEVCVYVHDFFVNGMLRAMPLPKFPDWLHDCCRNGVTVEREANDLERLAELYAQVEESIPVDDKYGVWLHFAQKWAELNALAYGQQANAQSSRHHRLQAKINGHFASWLAEHFAGLHGLATASGAMVHHISAQMARALGDKVCEKVALVVVDGLALHQWVPFRQRLQDQHPYLQVTDGASFAWIPTVTSVSRQAIFAGMAPSLFPKTIMHTSAEKGHWQRFWMGRDMAASEIVYGKGLGLGDATDDLEQLVHPEITKVIGLVVDTVDQIMHGSVLGASGLHGQVIHWYEQGYLEELIEGLVDLGFEIWLTSDHGNVECHGLGRPQEGSVADSRGQRMRIYSSKESQHRFAIQYEWAVPWKPVGLPDGYFPLLATGDGAFLEPGPSIVSHGGLSIEEVIVPLVRISKKIK